MTTLIRWTKFNLVGAIGMPVQIVALALFNSAIPGHYLLASAAAVEVTLLHNFLWHIHYTWPQNESRTHSIQNLRRPFLRFHLSNGLVSILGNLALMRLLVHRAHLPLLPANAIAILTCSLANFFLGNHWAFTPQRVDAPATTLPQPISTPTRKLALFILLFSLATAHSQSTSQLPDAPKPQQPPYVPSHSSTYLYHAGVFCGSGASTSSASTKPTAGCGAGLMVLPLPIFLEVGLMAPQANRSNFSAYLSADTSIALASSNAKYFPQAIIGYSRLFETGHALDYGLALNMPRPGKRADMSSGLRLELRDYYTFAAPTQHNVMLRVGWISEETD